MKNILIAIVVAAGLGYGLGRYLTPPKIQTKEVQTIKRDVVVVEKKIIQKDGTTIVETITTDKSKTETSKSTKTDSRSNYLITAGANLRGDRTEPIYDLSIQKRFIGPVFIGGRMNTLSELSVNLTIEL